VVWTGLWALWAFVADGGEVGFKNSGSGAERFSGIEQMYQAPAILVS
jgi:hypothetical protein